MTPGDRGWIVYDDSVLHVEYLGESTEPGLPDYPCKPEKYFRLLEDAPSLRANMYAGRIHQSFESENDQTVLHQTRKAALEEMAEYLEYLDQKKRAEQYYNYGELVAKIRAEIAASG